MLQLFSDKDPAEGSIVFGSFDDDHSSCDKHPLSEDFDQLQAWTCLSDLYCCAIRTMTWYRATVSNLTKIEWTREAMDSLVMDNMANKTLLRGLVEEHKEQGW